MRPAGQGDRLTRPLAGVTVAGLAGMGVAGLGLGRGLTATPVPNRSAQLRTGGLYAWVRHPLYTALLVFAVGVAALVSYRGRASILWPSLIGFVLVVFQAALGKVTVESELSGDIVTAHLATAMGLLALLIYIAVRSGLPARIGAGAGFSRSVGLTPGDFAAAADPWTAVHVLAIKSLAGLAFGALGAALVPSLVRKLDRSRMFPL